MAESRELLEQLQLAKQLQDALAGNPLIQARLSATIDLLVRRLPFDPAQTLQSSLESPNLSGRNWVSKFPGSSSPGECVEPFKTSLKAFLRELSRAGATVRITSTWRPPERAYLMHWCWKIAGDMVAPQDVPAMTGVNIEWVHRDSRGQVDIPKSRHAAREMVAGYGLVTQPALESRHTEGRAVDMHINWAGDLSVRKKNGSVQKITSAPRDGLNKQLHAVGADYGIIKGEFANDPPHWSDDGS